MRLRDHFKKPAMKRALASTALLGASLFSMGSNADPLQAGKTFTLHDSDNTALAVVEFRQCAEDMCMYIVEATPSAQEALGIPADAANYQIVKGLQTDGDHLDGGKIVNASWKANGAKVKVDRNHDGDLQITASKLGGKMEAKLLPKKGPGPV